MTIRELHNQAMALAQKALICADPDEVKALSIQACDLDEQAGDLLAPEIQNEPTRSILYKSAASLAFQAGEYERVKYLIGKVLEGYPSIFIQGECQFLLLRIPKTN